MGENPSNFYNDNVKYANPPSGGCNWDLDYYRTNYINAILLGQLKEGNYIKSGLVPSQGTGLDIEVTAGVAVIGGVEFEVNSFTKQAVLAPLGSVEFNLIYIDNAGVGQVIQSDPAVIGCALAIVDTDDTTILRFMDAVQLLQYDTTPNPVFQNHIIDGDFNFWYEGINQTSSGYGSDTMWNNLNAGSTKVHSRQDFTLGQVIVPNNPKYFSRTVVTSVVGVANYVLKRQKIEDASSFAGETVTFSFWAKADSSKNIALEAIQDFGTGGSPSADVNNIASQLIPLTTVWVKHEITFAIPSITGKALGTDENSFLELRWWFDAGSNFNARSAGLGQQSGTFDIARVRLVEGEGDGDHINEGYAEVLQKVNRYFWRGLFENSTGYRYGGTGFGTMIAGSVSFQNSMRTGPAPLIVTTPTLANCSSPSLTASIDGIRLKVTSTSQGQYRATAGVYSADARL